jgi:hypothetical protein
MKRIAHRVERKRAKSVPPLPKEVTPTAPRAYVDRFGVELIVVWNGAKTDPPLSGIGE